MNLHEILGIAVHNLDYSISQIMPKIHWKNAVNLKVDIHLEFNCDFERNHILGHLPKCKAKAQNQQLKNDLIRALKVLLFT